jgi:hypothetical protein
LEVRDTTRRRHLFSCHVRIADASRDVNAAFASRAEDDRLRNVPEAAEAEWKA